MAALQSIHDQLNITFPKSVEEAKGLRRHSFDANAIQTPTTNDPEAWSPITRNRSQSSDVLLLGDNEKMKNNVSIEDELRY
jgi:hypothetical protein